MLSRPSPSIKLAALTDGPGDSVRSGLPISRVVLDMLRDRRAAPHISQVESVGWLRKVQRGHGMDVLGATDGAMILSLPLLSPSARPSGIAEFLRSTGAGDDSDDGLFEALDMAARRTCVHGGLIPHARHDGRGVAAVTEAGS